jgi:hypothetical protein
MILLGIISLSINGTIVDSDSWVTNSQFSVLAIDVAQGLFEEMGSKRFDEGNGPAAFTPYGAFGPEGEPDRSLFDDIDDYHRYRETLSTPIGTCECSVAVIYVQETNPDIELFTNTSLKKVTVMMWSDYIEGMITMEHVFAYLGE